MNRVEELFQQFNQNIAESIQHRQGMYRQEQEDQWKNSFQEKMHKLGEIYVSNTQILREFDQILSEPLEEETADILMNYSYNMARAFSDEYDLLLKIYEVLIPYYEERDEFAKANKLYIAQFYEINEVKHRMFSIKEYDYSGIDKVIASRDRYFELESVEDRAIIWDAYFLKIALCMGGKTIRPSEALVLYDEMLEMWNRPEVQALDGKDEKCLDYIESVKNSIPLAVYDIDNEDEFTKEKFCRLIKELYFFELQEKKDENDMSPILYASHLYVLYLQKEETLEEIFDALMDFYKVGVKKYQAEEALSYPGLEFMINVTELLFLWAEKGVDPEKTRKMVGSFVALADTRWKTVDDDKIPVLNELMKQLCHYIVRYTSTEESAEKYVYSMIIQRNFYSYIHSIQITKLSSLIFQEAFAKMPSLFSQYTIWGYEQLEEFVKKSATFHDVGTMDMIPFMYGKMHENSEEEKIQIKQHPVFGAKYVDQIDGMAKYKEIVLGHHKNYDGKGGYPENYDNTKAWNRIIVDIVHLADTIDTMFDSFIQKGNNLSFEEILRELHLGKGTKYNPMLVEVIEASDTLRKKMESAVGKEKNRVMFDFFQGMEDVMIHQDVEALIKETFDKVWEVEKSRDYEALQPYLDKMFEAAGREHSDRLFGIAYYYTMRYHIMKQEFMNGINCGMEAARYLDKTEEYSNLCGVHNSIGICMQCQGNAENGITHFLLCAEYAQLGKNEKMEGVAYNNAASIFKEVDLFDKAIEYYEKAESCFKNQESYLLNLYYNILYCYIGLDQRESILHYQKLIQELKQKLVVDKDYSSFVSNVYEAYMSNYFGDTEMLEQCIYEIKNNLKVFEDYRLYIEEINVYLDLLEKLGRYEELTEQLDFYIEYCRKNNVAHYIFNSFLQKRIMCAYRMQDFEMAGKISAYLGKVIAEQSVNRADVALQIESTHLKDIKRQRTQREILKENEQLEIEVKATKNATAAKTTFLSSMSHEIRTPIHAVLGLDEMILRESHEDHIIQYAKDIQTAGNTLLSIVNDVLDFSKMEAGKIEIIPERYELSRMILDICDVMGARAREKQLEFHVDCQEDIPDILYGDNVRMKQILVNIISNAIKYTHRGKVEMMIRFVPKAQGMVTLRFSVRDTGIGIKEEEIDKLMRPFERIEESRNRSIEGTGLGMSIVNMLINEMKGELKVESEYGKGSAFHVKLDQEVLEWKPIGKLDLTCKQVEEKQKLLYAPKAEILLVDDNAVNLKVVKNLLRRTGIQVTTARSGQQCLELVTEKKFHLILLDHQMPEMDGLETLVKLKEMSGLNERTPVFALTANNMAGAMEFYQKAGFDDFLSKPVDYVVMEQKIKAYLPKDLLEEK